MTRRDFFTCPPRWHQTTAIYFATCRLAPGQKELPPEERELVAAELRHGRGRSYELHAYVVMNDHVHVLLEPAAEQALEKLVHTWKSFTAHGLQRGSDRQGRIWQEEYFDRIVRDEQEFAEKLAYIRANPWKRWPELSEYPWVWPRES